MTQYIDKVVVEQGGSEQEYKVLSPASAVDELSIGSSRTSSALNVYVKNGGKSGSGTSLPAVSETYAGIMTAAQLKQLMPAIYSDWSTLPSNKLLTIICTKDELEGIAWAGEIKWASENARVVRLKATSVRVTGTLSGKSYAVEPYSVTLMQPVNITSTQIKSAFNNKRLSEIKLAGVFTSEVYDSFLWNGIYDIRKIDLSKMATDSVTEWSWTFQNCQTLEEVNMQGFVTSSMTHFKGVFQLCKNLKKIDFRDWDMSNVKDIVYLFQSTPLEELDLRAWDMSSLEQMAQAFCNMTELKRLNLRGWRSEHLVDVSPENGTIQNMWFYGCKELEWLDMRDFTLKSLTNTVDVKTSAFVQCSKLHTLYFYGFGESPNLTQWSFAAIPWGTGGEESLESLKLSLITESFDRAAAGYSAMTLTLNSQTKALLSAEEKAAIVAKGYTIA